MACIIGSARIDERGKISGGAAGDQTGKEVSTENWYLHKKGWVVIRAKDPAKRAKIAQAMKAACDNNNIGYDQSNRYGLFNAVKSKGFNPAAATEKTECDCSALVRVCCRYAGINVGDFNTSSELSVLKATGEFDILTDSKYTKSSDYLLAGDILVTASKGHTVVVITNGAKANQSSKPSTTTNGKPAVAKPTIKNGTKGDQAKLLQQDLNYVIGAGLSTDGVFGPKSVAALKNFQSRNKLTADGIYGKDSYNKMKSILG